MEKSISETPVIELIAACIGKVRAGQPTRENSLVITKLEEAMLWQGQYERALLETARRSGVGMSVRTNVQGHVPNGIVLTEPVDMNPPPAPEAPKA